MRDFSNDKLQKSWCDGDLSLQICAFTPETCQAALRDIIKHTVQTAVIRWSIDGWQPKSEPGAMAARNLLGFRDGTGNPKVSDPKTADEVLWTDVAANSLDEPEWAKTAAIRQSALSATLSSFGTGRRFKSKPTFSGGANTAVRRWTAKKKLTNRICQRP